MIEIHTLPQGSYVVGDPFSLLPSSICDGIWGNEYKYYPGNYTALGYPMVIYEVYHEKYIIDNIGRKFELTSNMIGIFPIEMCICSNEPYLRLDVVPELQIYQNGGHLHLLWNDIHIVIDIGMEETFSERESDDTIDKYLERMNKESVNKEFESFEEEDEEYRMEIDIDEKVEEEKWEYSQSEDDESEEKNEPSTTFSFFKKR